MSLYGGMQALDGGHVVSLATLFVVLVVTSYTELKENRIPNWITIPGVMIGLLVGYSPWGITLGASVGGLVVGFGFLFIFYMFGGMGGGDVKLMGTVGALLGYPLIMTTLVYTAIVGGFMAIAVLVWNKNLWHGITSSIAMLFRKEKPEEERTEEAEAKMGAVPYGIAIICGCMMTLFFTAV